MSKNIVRVYRPELTPEERAKRMRSIERAAVNLVHSYYETQAEKRRKGVH